MLSQTVIQSLSKALSDASLAHDQLKTARLEFPMFSDMRMHGDLSEEISNLERTIKKISQLLIHGTAVAYVAHAEAYYEDDRPFPEWGGDVYPISSLMPFSASGWRQLSLSLDPSGDRIHVQGTRVETSLLIDGSHYGGLEECVVLAAFSSEPVAWQWINSHTRTL